MKKNISESKHLSSGNLLYYPYINLPDTKWTVRTLLYYDTVSSIVPTTYYGRYNDPYDDFTRQLIDNRLLIPVEPLMVLEHWMDIAEEYIKFINSPDFQLNTRLKHFHRIPIHGKRRAELEYIDRPLYRGTRLHPGKFDYQIFETLQQAGLAVRQDEWFIVETRTAKELMAFLANVIAAKQQLQITTNEMPVNHRFSLQKYSSNIIKSKNYEEKRNIILKELIPYPKEVDLRELRKFKDQHPDLLKAFRNRVELLVLNPSIEPGTLLFDESVRELELRKEELSAKMKESHLGDLIFGTVCGILGAATSIWTQNWIPLIPQFLNSIHSALKIEKVKNIPDQTGMKYLALVDHQIRKKSLSRYYRNARE